MAGRRPMFTEAAIRAMRRAYDTAVARGERPNLKPFWTRYDVHPSTVSQICLRETYRWVD